MTNTIPNDVVEIHREMASLQRRLRFLNQLEKAIVRYYGAERDAQERQQRQLKKQSGE